MARTGIVIEWGARVASEDGWSGKIRGAFLAPRTASVTHILVQRGLFKSTSPAAFIGMRQSEHDLLMLSSRADSSSPGRGSVRMSEKTHVSIAGKSAPLQGLIVDQRTGAPHYILVRHNNETKAVRSSLVQNITSGSPSIRITQAEAAALPVYRPDSEALRNALAALERADPTGGSTFGDVRVHLEEGLACLSGTVRLQVQKEAAENAVRLAKGVLDVQNEIVTDWDLRIEVAEALAKECMTHKGLVSVRSRRGIVTLAGHLPSRELIDMAVAIASGVQGTRSVAQEIGVRPEAVIANVPELATAADQGSDEGATQTDDVKATEEDAE